MISKRDTSGLKFDRWLASGIASMRADLPSRSAKALAVQSCSALYPARGIHGRLTQLSRGKAGVAVIVATFGVAHTIWANEPISPPPALTVASPTSQLSMWLKADRMINVTPSTSSWWATSYQTQSYYDFPSHGIIDFSTKLNADTMDVDRAITTFVKNNKAFYKVMDSSLRQPWSYTSPQTGVVLPAGERLWCLGALYTSIAYTEINVQSYRSLYDTLNVTEYDGSNHIDPKFRQPSILDPPTELQLVGTVLGTAMRARTFSAAVRGQYDLAAQYAIQEVRLALARLKLSSNSGTAQMLAQMDLRHANGELLALSNRTSAKESSHVVRTLERMDEEFPNSTEIIDADLQFNRYRLAKYLQNVTLTPLTVTSAVMTQSLMQRVFGNGQRVGVDGKEMIRQSLMLNKPSILADYDRYANRLTSLSRKFAPGVVSGMSGVFGHDSIAYVALDSLTDMVLANSLQVIHTQLRIAEIEYAIREYYHAKRNLPSTLNQLWPTYLARVPFNVVHSASGAPVRISYRRTSRSKLQYVLFGLRDHHSAYKIIVDENALPNDVATKTVGIPKVAVRHVGVGMQSTAGARS
jgi:hypothetical protein